MVAHQSADEAEFTDYQKVLGAENLPETFAEFQEMKYNEPDRFERMKRSYQTFAKIDRRGWPEPFTQRAKEAYWSFGAEGVEMSDHGLERFLNRKDKSGKYFIKEDIVSLMHRPANYIQDDLREVRYYDGIAIICNPKTKEIISIVRRGSTKDTWREVND